MKYLAESLMFFCFLQGCTFAPFSNHYAARSIGKHKVSANVGVESALSQAYFARGGFGLTENLDVGLVMEHQIFGDVFGGWGRYAFLNQKQGPSASVELGGGGSSLSSYGYVGAALGYKLKWWEPYLIARYNYVHYDNEWVFDLGDFGEYRYQNKGSFDYPSLTLGQTLWLKDDKVGLNFNVNFTNSYTADNFAGIGIVFVF